MIDLNTASFVLSFIALSISFYTLYIERIIIEIKSIVPGISGIKEMDNEWKHTIGAIQVEVYNKGKRDAKNCEGLVTFKKMDSLALYSTEKGNVLSNTKKFDLLAGERKNLVAAWNFSETAIDGNAGFEKGAFLEKAPPITVVIYCGEKKIRKKLKRNGYREKYEKIGRRRA